MLISRRTFIVMTGLLPAAPLAARVTAVSTSAQMPLRIASSKVDARELLLKIDGWNVHEPGGNDAWFTINRSWRTAWR